MKGSLKSVIGTLSRGYLGQVVADARPGFNNFSKPARPENPAFKTIEIRGKGNNPGFAGNEKTPARGPSSVKISSETPTAPKATPSPSKSEGIPANQKRRVFEDQKRTPRLTEQANPRARVTRYRLTGGHGRLKIEKPVEEPASREKPERIGIQDETFYRAKAPGEFLGGEKFSGNFEVSPGTPENPGTETRQGGFQIKTETKSPYPDFQSEKRPKKTAAKNAFPSEKEAVPEFPQKVLEKKPENPGVKPTGYKPLAPTPQKRKPSGNRVEIGSVDIQVVMEPSQPVLPKKTANPEPYRGSSTASRQYIRRL